MASGLRWQRLAPLRALSNMHQFRSQVNSLTPCVRREAAAQSPFLALFGFFKLLIRNDY
jgi:hypothetical protein